MLSFKDIGVTTLTFWGHVMSCDQWTCHVWFPISRQYEQTMISKRFWGYNLDLLWSRDVICHVTIGLIISGFL